MKLLLILLSRPIFLDQLQVLLHSNVILMWLEVLSFPIDVLVSADKLAWWLLKHKSWALMAMLCFLSSVNSHSWVDLPSRSFSRRHSVHESIWYWCCCREGHHSNEAYLVLSLEFRKGLIVRCALYKVQMIGVRLLRQLDRWILVILSWFLHSLLLNEHGSLDYTSRGYFVYWSLILSAALLHLLLFLFNIGRVARRMR